jgi:hypothetical protein
VNGATHVVCGRCQHTEGAMGTDGAAANLCFRRMRLNCPGQVSAYYVNEELEPRWRDKGGPWRFFAAGGVEVPPKPHVPKWQRVRDAIAKSKKASK